MSSIFIGTWRHGSSRTAPNEATEPFISLTIPPDVERIKFVGQSSGRGFFVTEGSRFFSWSTRARYKSNSDDIFKPHPMPFDFPGFVCKQFCTNEHFCCALDITGYVVAWGKNFGKTPTKVDLPCPCCHISTDSSLLIATLTDGSILVTDQKRTNRHHRLPESEMAVKAVGVTHNKNTIFAAVSKTGNLYCWSKRIDSSPIWKMLTDLPQKIPVTVDGSEVKVADAFGYSNLWVVTSNNEVLCCGENAGSALGMSGGVPCDAMRVCELPFSGKIISDIAMGDDYTIVLTEDGVCYAAGRLDGVLPLSNPDTKSSNYDHFVTCNFFDGQRVTHISCSTLSAMFLTNGAHRSSAPSDSFRLCPIPEEPSPAIVDGERDVMIRSGVSEFAAIGLKERDVFSLRAGDSGMLVGVLVSDPTKAVLSTDFQTGLVSVDLSKCNSEFPLIERPGRTLVQYEQIKYRVDPEGQFYGFRHGDTLKDGSVILGESGNRVFYRDIHSNEIIELKEFSEVFRNGNELVVREIDGRLVCTEMIRRHKVLHASLGCGVIVSQTEKDFVVRFAGDLGDHLIPHKSKQLVIQERGPRESQVFVSPTDAITISHETDLLLDLVMTPDGYGTVAGVTSEGKVAVWCEKNHAEGIVTVFPRSSVTPVARIETSLLVDGLYEANCAEFAAVSSSLLPGDEVSGGLTVVGLKDGLVYARTSSGSITTVSPTTPVLVRHVFTAHPHSTFVLKSASMY